MPVPQTKKNTQDLRISGRVQIQQQQHSIHETLKFPTYCRSKSRVGACESLGGSSFSGALELKTGKCKGPGKKKKNLDCQANKDLMMMGELRKKNARKGIDGYDS